MEPELNHSSVVSIVTAAERSGLPISAIVLRQQAEQTEQTEESICEHVRKNYRVMAECIKPGCNKDLKSTSGPTGGSTFKVHQISESGKSLTGSFLSGALYRALAVSEFNAAMGQVVAASTARSYGILPAALLIMQEEKRVPERDCVMSLLTASIIGTVIANNASLTGAQGGCQAECGPAAAMAAAAIMELAGGIPETVEHTIAIAIKNILGLVCDPVAGPAEIPCIERNASGATGAFVAAELVLAGTESAILADKVIQTIKKTGDAMSSTLKETAKDGLAAIPTGRRLHEHVSGATRGAHSGCSRCGGCSS